LSAAILLLLMAQVAASAVESINIGFGTHGAVAALQQIFAGWRGSRLMIVLAVICLVLVIAARGIERR
jgi:hypothetical protein